VWPPVYWQKLQPSSIQPAAKNGRRQVIGAEIEWALTGEPAAGGPGAAGRAFGAGEDRNNYSKYKSR